MRSGALFFLGLAAAAQAQKATIEGTVLRDDTGAPLAGAQVRLKSRKAAPASPEARTTSNADGRFAFAGFPADVYILRVDLPGYPTYSTQFAFSINPIRYTGVDGKLAELVMRIAPVTSISGRVTDATGKAISNVTLRAMRYGYSRTGRELFGGVSTRTDGTGDYRLEGLAPGKYLVRAHAPDAAMNRAAVPSYFPSTNDFAKATTVETAPGKDAAKIDIRLVRPAGVTISGRAGRGTPPIVFLVRRNLAKEDYGSGVIKPDGTFEIANVPPGPYTLKSPTGSLRIDVGAAKVVGLTIPPNPIFDLKGMVRVEDTASTKAAGVKIVMVPDDGSAALATVNADGSFVFPSVTSAVYRIKLAIRQDFYIAAAKFGGKDVLNGGIDLTRAKSSPGALELVIHTGAGRVDGKALGERGKALGVVSVVLVPDPPDRKRSVLYRVIPSEANGAFSITGVAPGKYKLFAWRQLDTEAYENPEFLAPYEARGKAVIVTPGSVQAVDLAVIR
jgi:hypothetical protein